MPDVLIVIRPPQDTIFSEVFWFYSNVNIFCAVTHFPLYLQSIQLAFFIILISIFREAVHNSLCPSRCNHCSTEFLYSFIGCCSFCIYNLLKQNDEQISQRSLSTTSLGRWIGGKVDWWIAFPVLSGKSPSLHLKLQSQIFYDGL